MKLLLASVALLAAASAWAHHGWSEYESDKPTTLTGTIRDTGYEHPHGHITLAVPGKTWQVVLAPPSRMQNRGLAQGMLKPGNQATVMGYPNRSKPDELRAARITIDGKTVELR